jgi:hypothetical protein
MKKTTMWDEMRKMHRDMDSLFNDFFIMIKMGF